MKKVFRFFCTATSAAAILATVVSMSACNNHEHVWGDWQHDADGHWRVCTEEGCDAEDRDAHSGTPCVYCGYGFKALSFGFTEGGDAAHADFAREANEWFAAQGEAEGFTYDFAGTDFSKLNDDTLENYDMVIFLNDRPSGRRGLDRFSFVRLFAGRRPRRKSGLLELVSGRLPRLRQL